MDDSTHSDFSAACSRVQRKLEQWRQRHRPRVPISEGLWREAAELARTHGINRTARALRLDYYSLQKRVAAAAGSGEAFEVRNVEHGSHSACHDGQFGLAPAQPTPKSFGGHGQDNQRLEHQ